MDDNKEYIRIFGKLLAQQSYEFVRCRAVVQSQGTSNPEYPRLFAGVRGNGTRHRMLESRDALATASLLRQCDGFLGRQRSLGTSRFRSLREYHPREEEAAQQND